MSEAARLRERLRADLKQAMQERRREEANLLRTLVAAIDNAEAVPLPPGHKPADSARFADGTAEAARRVLDQEALAAILAGEIASRREAAATIAAGGEAERAARLEAEALFVARYLPA